MFQVCQPDCSPDLRQGPELIHPHSPLPLPKCGWSRGQGALTAFAASPPGSVRPLLSAQPHPPPCTAQGFPSPQLHGEPQGARPLRALHRPLQGHSPQPPLPGDRSLWLHSAAQILIFPEPRCRNTPAPWRVQLFREALLFPALGGKEGSFSFVKSQNHQNKRSTCATFSLETHWRPWRSRRRTPSRGSGTFPSSRGSSSLRGRLLRNTHTENAW